MWHPNVHREIEEEVASFSCLAPEEREDDSTGRMFRARSAWDVWDELGLSVVVGIVEWSIQRGKPRKDLISPEVRTHLKSFAPEVHRGHRALLRVGEARERDNRRERAASDPVYAEALHRKNRVRGVQDRQSLERRAAADPKFAELVAERRRAKQEEQRARRVAELDAIDPDGAAARAALHAGRERALRALEAAAPGLPSDEVERRRQQIRRARTTSALELVGLPPEIVAAKRRERLLENARAKSLAQHELIRRRRAADPSFDADYRAQKRSLMAKSRARRRHQAS